MVKRRLGFGVIGWILKRLGAACGRITNRSQTTPDGGVVVNLYECSNCDDTYMSTELETCPECGNGLDALASERELGLK